MAKYINGLKIDDSLISRIVVSENETVKYYPTFRHYPAFDEKEPSDENPSEENPSEEGSSDDNQSETIIFYDGGGVEGW